VIHSIAAPVRRAEPGTPCAIDFWQILGMTIILAAVALVQLRAKVAGPA
jgi:hypothetical protein